ncbi:hypothetical protein ACQ4PT_058480 [Festuca glaucescens]
MEDPPRDSGQSTNGPEPELESMILDDNGESGSHTMDDSNGQSSMDVDRDQSFMDADMNGKPSLDLDDESKGKYSSSHPEVPIDMSLGSLEKFCKEASRSFFGEIGLISHQLNSYNQFVSHGLQELFDSLEEITVEPDYDPSKKGPGGWRHAIIKFGKAKLHKPVFWSEKKSLDLSLKPRHARLQNMTYSSKMEVDVNIKVYSMEKSDKAKTGNDLSGHSKVLIVDENQTMPIGRLPVMVNSNLCWLHKDKKSEHKDKKSDCLFDSGRYFLIKGLEKV